MESIFLCFILTSKESSAQVNKFTPRQLFRMTLEHTAENIAVI
jgi:hypothetical protein